MDKSALRFCISGGEACPDGLSEQIEAAFGTPHVAAYGMTECMSGIAHSRHDLFGRRVKEAVAGSHSSARFRFGTRMGASTPARRAGGCVTPPFTRATSTHG